MAAGLWSHRRYPVGSSQLGMPTVEPEALERCQQLRVPLFTSEAAALAATARGGGDGAVAGSAVAHFDEAKVWEHYSHVTRDIWFFNVEAGGPPGL